MDNPSHISNTSSMQSELLNHINAEEIASLMSETREKIDYYLRLMKAISLGHYYDAYQLLKRSPDISLKLAELLSKSAIEMRSLPLESNLQEVVKRLRLHYHEDLENEFDKLSIRRSGQWPSYVLGDVLRLRIDLQRGVATLENKKLGTLEPSLIVEQVKSKLDELFSRPFNASEYLLLLRSASRKIASTQGRESDEYIDIRDVFAFVRTHMKQYGHVRRYNETKFQADIYRLLRDRRPITEDGFELELSPAQNATGGMYIQTTDTGNYIAAIRFVRK